MNPCRQIGSRGYTLGTIFLVHEPSLTRPTDRARTRRRAPHSHARGGVGGVDDARTTATTRERAVDDGGGYVVVVAGDAWTRNGDAGDERGRGGHVGGSSAKRRNGERRAADGFGGGFGNAEDSGEHRVHREDVRGVEGAVALGWCVSEKR